MDPISSIGAIKAYGLNTKPLKAAEPAPATASPVDIFGEAAAFLDLSTRGRMDGAASDRPLSREEATEVAKLVGKMVSSGIIGWEWRKDSKGKLHRVFLENTLAGTPKEYKPLRPGEK